MNDNNNLLCNKYKRMQKSNVDFLRADGEEVLTEAERAARRANRQQAAQTLDSILSSTASVLDKLGIKDDRQNQPTIQVNQQGGQTPPRSRTWIWIVAALAIGGVGFVIYKMTKK